MGDLRHGADTGGATSRRSTSDRPAMGECPPGRDPAHYLTPMEARIEEMRALLAQMRPESDAEALQALRTAFPEASLAARVAAIAGRRA